MHNTAKMFHTEVWVLCDWTGQSNASVHQNLRVGKIHDRRIFIKQSFIASAPQSKRMQTTRQWHVFHTLTSKCCCCISKVFRPYCDHHSRGGLTENWKLERLLSSSRPICKCHRIHNWSATTIHQYSSHIWICAENAPSDHTGSVVKVSGSFFVKRQNRCCGQHDITTVEDCWASPPAPRGLGLQQLWECWRE